VHILETYFGLDDEDDTSVVPQVTARPVPPIV
jgi:hypothetical protein